MMTVILHRFIDGPYEGEDDTWYSLCLIEDDDENVVISEVTFETLEDALEVKETLTTTLYALEVEADSCSTTTLN
jgi:hypothetical protein